MKTSRLKKVKGEVSADPKLLAELEEDLSRMGCVGLLHSHWDYRHSPMVEELASEGVARPANGTIRARSEHWIVEVRRTVYDFQKGGKRMATKDYKKGQFQHNQHCLGLWTCSRIAYKTLHRWRRWSTAGQAHHGDGEMEVMGWGGGARPPSSTLLHQQISNNSFAGRGNIFHSKQWRCQGPNVWRAAREGWPHLQQKGNLFYDAIVC